MKVLILNSLYPTPLHPKIVGGAEKSVRHLAEALTLEGHEVEVICGVRPGAAPTCETVNGVVVYGAPIRNVYWPHDGRRRPAWMRLLWHLVDDWGDPPAIVRERLDSFRPDVLHTNTLAGLTTNVWRLAKMRGVRVVHTLRDYYLICPRANYFKRGRNCENPCGDCRALTQRRRQNTALPDVVVGNSYATLNLHLDQNLFSGVRLLKSIGSISEASRPLPKRDRSDDPRTIFGYIGRVTPEKGVEMLAHAYGKMPEGIAGLVIAGETNPEIQDRLSEIAGRRDIQFLGFVSPEFFYRKVDIVVAPSLWHEPLPRSVIDAVGYNRPVIGSNKGGTPEAMGDPPYGWIFDPDAPGGLENAMRSAMAEQSPSPPPLTENSSSPLHQYITTYMG